MTHVLSPVKQEVHGFFFLPVDCGTHSNLKICLPGQEGAQALEK